ncbi:hypothetical protein ACFQ0I_15150 [Mariniflexile aquimaris]|uniref:Uncharacterized protein n=1 Tax=Mariniflexile aquimaris TaxID=881009 RepID=A0ABW3BXA9_9FLAO
MEKYVVTVNIMSANEKGLISSKSSDYTFQEKDIIQARNKAITKVKELEEEFLYGEIKYDSFLVAQLKDFKNFNAYAINLLFVPDENFTYCLYGEDKQQTYEALKIEGFICEQYDNISLTEIEYTDGEWIEVIESNLDFFVN